MAALLRGWRYLYGENPLHLLAMIGCFALAGYVVSLLWDEPSLPMLAVWFAGAVLGHDLLLYPLYALADQPLTISRWARRKLLPQRPPAVPAINHVRVPALGSGVLGLVWFPSITGRGGEAFEFTAGHAMVGQYENWLLITGALFTGSAVVYAVRLGAAAGSGVVGLVRRGRVGASTAVATAPPPAEAPNDVPTEAFPASEASGGQHAGEPTEVLAASDPHSAEPTEAFPTSPVEAGPSDDGRVAEDVPEFAGTTSGPDRAASAADAGAGEAADAPPEPGDTDGGPDEVRAAGQALGGRSS